MSVCRATLHLGGLVRGTVEPPLYLRFLWRQDPFKNPRQIASATNLLGQQQTFDKAQQLPLIALPLSPPSPPKLPSFPEVLAIAMKGSWVVHETHAFGHRMVSAVASFVDHVVGMPGGHRLGVHAHEF